MFAKRTFAFVLKFRDIDYFSTNSILKIYLKSRFSQKVLQNFETNKVHNQLRDKLALLTPDCSKIKKGVGKIVAIRLYRTGMNTCSNW